MADDAAAPEGKLSESDTDTPDATLEGTSESPDVTDSETTTDEAEDFDAAVEDADEGTSDDEASDDEASNDEAEAAPAKPKRAPISHLRLGAIIGLVIVVALGGLVGWLGYQTYRGYQADKQRALFLQVGKQAAVNLTTIDFENADRDVKRILDGATDVFYDDFFKRSGPFIEVVKQAQSKSVGEVTGAGVESEDADTAQILVAVTVKTSNAGAPEQAPRAWRMRIIVKKVGDDAKVSNVEFVP
jgi:Mce-associated membrane protein